MLHRSPVLALAALVAVTGAACARIHVDPLYMTLDINIRVDRALDDFFGHPPTAVPSASSATPTATPRTSP